MSQVTKTGYKFVLGALCLMAVVAIGIFLSGDFDSDDGRLLGTCMSLVVLAATSLSGAQLIDKRPSAAALGYGTVLASVLAFVATTAAIWSDGDGVGWRLAVALIVISLASSHCSILVRRYGSATERGVPIVMALTIGVTALLALLVLLPLVEEEPDYGDQYWRFLAVVVVLWILGNAALPIVRKMNRAPQAPAPAESGTTQAPPKQDQPPPSPPPSE